MGENYSDFKFISLSKNSKTIKFMHKFANRICVHELHLMIASLNNIKKKDQSDERLLRDVCHVGRKLYKY
jgi:hypothetical protein